MKARLRWLAAIALLGLLAGGLLYRGGSRPHPVARLIQLLPEALETPAPPKPKRWLSLQEFPPALAADAIGVAVALEPRRPFVTRVRLHQTAHPATAEIRSLNAAELKAFGPSPKAISGRPPGTLLGPCIEGAVHDEWATCSRVENIPSSAAAALVIVYHPDQGASHLQIEDAAGSDPRAPRSPSLTPLVKLTPCESPQGTDWRSALIAPPGARYVFELVAPEEPELWLATGHEEGDDAGPVRFVAKEGTATLLDEVTFPDQRWHDHHLRLDAKSGRKTRISLESYSVEGVGGAARGLWANPRVLGHLDAPSILMITVDALRPDHLSAYGYGRDTSPTLQKLAQTGVRFERAVAQAATTWTSIPSLLTGRYPANTKVRDRGDSLPSDVPLIADLLAARGYDTFAGSDLGMFPFQMLSSFDQLERVAGPGEKPSVVKQVEALASRFRFRPTFAWIHLEHPHYPLQPRQPLRYDSKYEGRFKFGFSRSDKAHFLGASALTQRETEHLEALYDASVRDADDEIREILATLDSAGALDHTLLVITADHGELIGEHGFALEHTLLYDPVLHVPLIFSWFDHLPEGESISQRVQLIDVVPTLLGLAGLAAAPGLDGRDLSPLMRGKSLPDLPAYAEGKNGQVYAQYRGDEKLIFNPTHLETLIKEVPIRYAERELYDLRRDPREQDNLAMKDPARAEEAVQALNRHLLPRMSPGDTDSSPGLGQAALSALRQAGYLQENGPSAHP